MGDRLPDDPSQADGVVNGSGVNVVVNDNVDATRIIDEKESAKEMHQTSDNQPDCGDCDSVESSADLDKVVPGIVSGNANDNGANLNDANLNDADSGEDNTSDVEENVQESRPTVAEVKRIFIGYNSALVFVIVGCELLWNAVRAGPDYCTISLMDILKHAHANSNGDSKITINSDSLISGPESESVSATMPRIGFHTLWDWGLPLSMGLVHLVLLISYKGHNV